MIGSEGGEKDTDEWGPEDDDRLEKYGDAAYDDYVSKLVEEGLKERLKDLGAKTGAANRSKKVERAKLCQAAADAIWAERPHLTKKAVAHILEKKNREVFGSANTIRELIKNLTAK